MKCETCGCEFKVCDCGVSCLVGSSSAEHSMHCPKGPFVDGPLFGGAISHDKIYAPWEAPAPQCPNCYKGTDQATMNELRFSENIKEALKGYR